MNSRGQYDLIKVVSRAAAPLHIPRTDPAFVSAPTVGHLTSLPATPSDGC